jgi:PAS domain-containing protein
MTYWHPQHSPSSEIIGVNVAAAEEITERKRAEAALQASERRFHTLMASKMHQPSRAVGVPISATKSANRRH